MVVAKRAASEGTTPQFYATVAYKRWVWARLDEKGWTLAKLVSAIKRADPSATASTAGLSQFLGFKDPKDGPTIPSNTTLMPVLNRVLGIAPPPICDPSDPLSQLRDRLAARWSKLSEREQKMLETLLAEDDVSPDSSN